MTSLRTATGWQLILADLALILFLVTLSALAGETERESAAAATALAMPQVDPSQALFRPAPLGPTLAEWLAARPHDARATLTVFAQYSDADRGGMWEQAQAMAASAEGEGYTVRVVMTRAATSDIHASLAYDAPITVQTAMAR